MIYAATVSPIKAVMGTTALSERFNKSFLMRNIFKARCYNNDGCKHSQTHKLRAKLLRELSCVHLRHSCQSPQSLRNEWVRAHHSEQTVFLLGVLMTYPYVLGQPRERSATKESCDGILDCTEP